MQRFVRFKTGPAGQGDDNWDGPEWTKADSEYRNSGDSVKYGKEQGRRAVTF